MRHLKKGRKFSRSTPHREAMRKNLTVSLFRHERVITTVEKAKDIRGWAEKWITLAKDKDLHRFRRAMSALQDKEVVRKLFDVLGPRFKERKGGYTRILKISNRRLGDNASMAVFELVDKTPVEEPEVDAKAKGKKKDKEAAAT